MTAPTAPAASISAHASHALPSRIRIARAAFRPVAWALVACIAMQVLLAGMAVMSGGPYWGYHTTFVHAFELLPLVLLGLALAGRARPALALTAFAAWFLIGLQYALAGMRPSPIAGVHALNALAIFWIALAFTRVTPATTAPGRTLAWK